MLLSAFFSGMEIAFVSSNRMLTQMSSDSRGLTAFFYRHPNTYVNTMLVGNNIALVVYGILVAELFDTTIFAQQTPAFRVAADTILSTVIVLFTGEFLPKTIFKNNATRALTLFAPLAALFYILLFPISRFCTMLSRALLRLCGIKVAAGTAEGFSKVDLDYLVDQAVAAAPDNENTGDEVRIFQNALDLADTKVRDCMRPRTEITAVPADTPLEELRQVFIESGRSKVIVYKDDIDHITGYIHSSELFRLGPRSTWTTHIRRLPFVPETMPARRLMEQLLAQKTSLAVVIDEFGGTAGVVALEDIVEEITGEIEDEHDKTTFQCRANPDGTYTLSARIEIERANQLLGITLPESDDYKTVGGLILAKHQAFPRVGDDIEIGNMRFHILRRTNTRIELVSLTIQQNN